MLPTTGRPDAKLLEQFTQWEKSGYTELNVELKKHQRRGLNGYEWAGSSAITG